MAARLKATPSFTFDKATHAYTDASGKRLSQADLRGYVDKAVESARGQARKIAEDFLTHRNSAEFETAMKALLKNEHLSLSMIANGGREQMTQSLWAKAGNVIKSQYQYLEAMGRSLDAGEISDAQLLARSELYANAGIGTFESFIRDGMAEIGMIEALNILGGGNHCSECPALTDAGWMPIEDMPMPGERECRVNCLCSVDYR